MNRPRSGVVVWLVVAVDVLDVVGVVVLELVGDVDAELVPVVEPLVDAARSIATYLTRQRGSRGGGAGASSSYVTASLAKCAAPLLAVSCASPLCRRGASCLQLVVEIAPTAACHAILAALVLPLAHRQLLKLSLAAPGDGRGVGGGPGASSGATTARRGGGRLPIVAPRSSLSSLPGAVQRALVSVLERAMQPDVDGEVASAAAEVLASLEER